MHHISGDYLTRNVVQSLQAIQMALESKKTVRFSITLVEEQYKKISSLAERNDVSVAWIVRQAITQFLEESGDQLALPFSTVRTEKVI